MDMTISVTVFISPSVFSHDNTSVNFTSINSSIVVFITSGLEGTEVFRINVVVHGNLSITSRVVDFNDFFRDFVDISTFPSTFTSDFTITVDVTGRWTVIISPFIFESNNTGIHFTHIN